MERGQTLRKELQQQENLGMLMKYNLECHIIGWPGAVLTGRNILQSRLIPVCRCHKRIWKMFWNLICFFILKSFGTVEQPT